MLCMLLKISLSFVIWIYSLNGYSSSNELDLTQVIVDNIFINLPSYKRQSLKGPSVIKFQYTRNYYQFSL